MGLNSIDLIKVFCFKYDKRAVHLFYLKDTFYIDSLRFYLDVFSMVHCIQYIFLLKAIKLLQLNNCMVSLGVIPKLLLELPLFAFEVNVRWGTKAAAETAQIHFIRFTLSWVLLFRDTSQIASFLLFSTIERIWLNISKYSYSEGVQLRSMASQGQCSCCL
jgi:hypothetical protein